MPRPKLDASVLLLLALSVALALFHYSYTPVLLRNPDASQHLAYIQFLLDRHALPRATDCSVCHHPPLYYLAAAALAQVCRALGTAPERTLQLASWTLMFAVNVLYAYVNTALFPRPAQRAWATALVAFWPLGIIASARVNNDVGFYAFAAGVFFCLVRWWRRPQARWLVAAAAVALGALGVKANAMVLVGLVLALVAYRSYRLRSRPERTSIAVALGLLLGALALSALRGEPGASLPARALGSAYKSSSRELDARGPRYYLAFDPVSFVKQPRAESAIPKSAEPTFWNHWLKSSLLGTKNRGRTALFEVEPRRSETVARALNASLLGLLGFGFVGAWLSRKYAGPYRGFLAVCVGVWVVAGVGFHAFVPTGHHADFRFVLPVVAPASALLVDVAYGLRRRGLLLWHAGYILSELVLAFSTAYLFALKP